MIVEFFSDLGIWSWFIIGLLLLIGEVVLPGIFLIWFGLAAILVGVASLVFPAGMLSVFFDEGTDFWPWQAQVVAFGILSFVMVMVGMRFFPNNKNDEASKMNDPLGRMIGRKAVLSEPLENGVGRVKLGDTLWRVQGSDLPKGTQVVVTGQEGGSLVVEKA